MLTQQVEPLEKRVDSKQTGTVSDVQIIAKTDHKRCYICHDGIETPEYHIVPALGDAKLHSDGCIQYYLLSPESKNKTIFEKRFYCGDLLTSPIDENRKHNLLKLFTSKEVPYTPVESLDKLIMGSVFWGAKFFEKDIEKEGEEYRVTGKKVTESSIKTLAKIAGVMAVNATIGTVTGYALEKVGLLETGSGAFTGLMIALGLNSCMIPYFEIIHEKIEVSRNIRLLDHAKKLLEEKGRKVHVTFGSTNEKESKGSKKSYSELDLPEVVADF